MQYQFKITTNGYASEIQFTIKFNDLIVAQFECDNQMHTIDYTMSDSDDDTVKACSFQITMEGKKESHTVVSDDGNIESDCYAILEQIIFEEIDVTDEFAQGQKIYLHNNNGNGELITDEFYGFIGCNGVVTMEFSTPLHLWMLEKCR